MPTLYRCSGYIEEICGKCPEGESHTFDTCFSLRVSSFCKIRNISAACIEYDRDPCGDPTCPDCTGGDGVSCK